MLVVVGVLVYHSTQQRNRVQSVRHTGDEKAGRMEVKTNKLSMRFSEEGTTK